MRLLAARWRLRVMAIPGLRVKAEQQAVVVAAGGAVVQSGQAEAFPLEPSEGPALEPLCDAPLLLGPLKVQQPAPVVVVLPRALRRGVLRLVEGGERRRSSPRTAVVRPGWR